MMSNLCLKIYLSGPLVDNKDSFSWISPKIRLGLALMESPDNISQTLHSIVSEADLNVLEKTYTQ